MKGYPQTINIILNKTSKTGILFSGVINLNGSQGALLRYKEFAPIILGYREIIISKSWSDYDCRSGDFVIVTINVTNMGNVVIQNITVNDVFGFPKLGFILYKGALDKVINEIKPNESIIYTYTLINNKQGIYKINAAYIKYYYLIQKINYSNELTIKVRNKFLINGLWILLPAGFGLISIISLYWWKNRYDIESAEFERREELMFGVDYRTSAWDKFVIEEHLDQLEKGLKLTTKREKEEVY